MTDRTNGALDRAVIAHREHPNPETLAELLKAQQAHTDHFYAEQTGHFQERSHAQC